MDTIGLQTRDILAFYNSLVGDIKRETKRIDNIKDTTSRRRARAFYFNELCQNTNSDIEHTFSKNVVETTKSLLRIAKDDTTLGKNRKHIIGFFKCIRNIHLDHVTDQRIENLNKRVSGMLNSGIDIKSFKEKLNGIISNDLNKTRKTSSSSTPGKLKSSLSIKTGNLDIYLKMKKMGVPLQAIINKMEADGNGSLVQELESDVHQSKVLNNEKEKLVKMEHIINVLENHHLDEDMIKSIVKDIFEFDI